MCIMSTDVVCLEGTVNPSVHGGTDGGGFNIPQMWQMYRD